MRQFFDFLKSPLSLGLLTLSLLIVFAGIWFKTPSKGKSYSHKKGKKSYPFKRVAHLNAPTASQKQNANSLKPKLTSFVTIDAKDPGGTALCTCPICHIVIKNKTNCAGPCPKCRKRLFNAIYAGQGHHLQTKKPLSTKQK